jgi:uncharacterized cupin superfamily protein
MIIRKDQAPVDHADEEDAQMYGASEWLHLSDEGGLTQFGAHVHTLQPGSRSSDRHWHEEEDEFLYMLSGEGTVIEEDGPTCSIPATRSAGQRAQRTPTRS